MKAGYYSYYDHPVYLQLRTGLQKAMANADFGVSVSSAGEMLTEMDFPM